MQLNIYHYYFVLELVCSPELNVDGMREKMFGSSYGLLVIPITIIKVGVFFAILLS